MFIHDLRSTDPSTKATYKLLDDFGQPKWNIQSTEVMMRVMNKHEYGAKEHIKYTQPHSWFPNPQMTFLKENMGWTNLIETINETQQHFKRKIINFERNGIKSINYKNGPQDYCKDKSHDHLYKTNISTII